MEEEVGIGLGNRIAGWREGLRLMGSQVWDFWERKWWDCLKGVGLGR